jgi:hypothetical protein
LSCKSKDKDTPLISVFPPFSKKNHHTAATILIDSAMHKSNKICRKVKKQENEKMMKKIAEKFF